MNSGPSRLGYALMSWVDSASVRYMRRRTRISTINLYVAEWALARITRD